MAANQTKERIVETAIKLFNKYGYKKVTMDDIAQSIHISKRTLYEIYSSKDELIMDCLTQLHQYIAKLRMDAISKTDDPMMMTLYIMRHTSNKRVQYSRLFDEAEQYYPELNAQLIKTYGKKFKDQLLDVFEIAQCNGDLRANIDIDAAIDVIIFSVRSNNNTLENDKTSNEAFSKRLREACFTYLRGLLSTKAIERIDQNAEKYREIINENDRPITLYT